MSIKLISFDFWGTIYHNTPSLKNKQENVILQFLKKSSIYDIDISDINRAALLTWERWDMYWKESYRTHAVYEWVVIVLENLQVELSEDSMLECCTALQSLLFTGNTKEVPEVRTVLETLHTRYKLSIISDTGIESGEYLRRLLLRDKLNYFGYSIFSDEFGRSKPHRSVFEALLTHYQLEPDEAVHIGDLRRTDVEGAKSVGMHTIRYSGCKNDENCMYNEADFVINDYSQLPEVIEKLCR
jgi:putative hydrolase of the HAD superfamily